MHSNWVKLWMYYWWKPRLCTFLPVYLLIKWVILVTVCKCRSPGFFLDSLPLKFFVMVHKFYNIDVVCSALHSMQGHLYSCNMTAVYCLRDLCMISVIMCYDWWTNAWFKELTVLLLEKEKTLHIQSFINHS